MNKFLRLISILLLGVAFYGQAQNSAIDYPERRNVTNTMEGWMGFYTKYRVAPKWYYYGEYHYRRRDYLQEMANVYLRFGITHIPNKNLEFTAGIVTPFYWAKANDYQRYPADNKVVDPVTMQFRFWQQMVSVMRLDRVKIYHQLRTEQRWARANYVESPYQLTFRFRYKFTVYAPINNHHLVPGTLFFSGYEEIFIQTGKSIVFNHFEDNRLFLGLGYIISDQLQVQAGYMWTYRHSGGPFDYQSRHVPRLSFYHNLDLFEIRQRRIRQSQTNVILNDEF